MTRPLARGGDARWRALPWDVIGLALLLVVMLFVPDALKAGFERASVSYLSIATNALSLAVLALSWDILARTGQLSLAHAAFYGAGAYTTAMLLKHASLPMWWGIPLGGLVAIAFAVVLGALTLRLRAIYFAIATLAFAEVLKAVAHHLPTSIAGGNAGMNVAPLFRPVFVAGEMERWELAFLRNEGYFYVYAGLLAVTVLASIVLQRSRLRHAFIAIRTNEDVAGVMGVRPARVKLLAFTVSSFCVGMLGAVEAHRIGSVLPDQSFSVATTVLALVTPIFGGLYTTLGPIVGALGLSSVQELLRRTFDDGYLIGYGVVLVLSILFMPRGVVGLVGRLLRRSPSAAPPSGPPEAIERPPVVRENPATETGGNP
jgi:branched-chain amino acid transport system permease protein